MDSFSFKLDQDSKVRLYFQLFTQISHLVDSGELAPGTKLPSVRSLSTDLNVSKNTVTKAYEELQAKGYIVSREKSGFYINDTSENPTQVLHQEDPVIPTVDSIISHASSGEPIFPPAEMPGSQELETELTLETQENESILQFASTTTVPQEPPVEESETHCETSSVPAEPHTDTNEPQSTTADSNANTGTDKGTDTFPPDITETDTAPFTDAIPTTETSTSPHTSSTPETNSDMGTDAETNTVTTLDSETTTDTDSITITNEGTEPSEAPDTDYTFTQPPASPQDNQENDIYDSSTQEDPFINDDIFAQNTSSTELDFIIPSDDTIKENESDLFFSSNFMTHQTSNALSIGTEEDTDEHSDTETGTDSGTEPSFSNEKATSPETSTEDTSLEELDPTENLSPSNTLPEMILEIGTPDDASLEESIRTSYNEILSLPGTFMHKKSPSFGESCLKYAICHLLKTFRNVEIAPEQIIIASTTQMLVHNVLKLSSLNPMSSLYSKYTPGIGLLKKAEKFKYKPDSYKKLTIGIVPGTYYGMEKTFTDLDLPVEHLEQDNLGIVPASLYESKTTLVFSSKKDVSISFINDLTDRRDKIISWAQEKPYRFILENDSYTVENKNLSFLNSKNIDKVIYINSFTNLICKGISGAWLILPKQLIPEYQSKYFFRDCTMSVLDQLFLTDFINSGKLDQYLNNLELL